MPAHEQNPHPRKRRKPRRRPFFIALVALLCAIPTLFSPVPAHAAEAPAERNFYDVLEDVLGDFEYDLKNGQVTGLRQVAIRQVSLSENVPSSFRSHLELLVTERILKTTKAQVLQCLPCRARQTRLSGDQVTFSSPETNPQELARIAQASGIAHFLDLAFSYQPHGIVLSMTISEPESGSIVWSRSYNSESSRAAAFRRGVDYSQQDEARKSTEYTPTLQYRAAVSYLFEPNLSGSTGCLGFGLKLVERYDNRKKEVGFEMQYLRDATTLVTSDASKSENNLYAGFNLTLTFVHAWNLIGEEENFNQVRGSLIAGVGGTYASGYLGGLLRAGYEWRMGKHLGIQGTLGYRPPATAFVGDSSSSGKSVSGVEFGLGVGWLF